MSSQDDISKAYSEMLKASNPSNEDPVSSMSATRTLADDLIDTVGVPSEKPKKLTCPECGSTDFNVRSEYGSKTTINQCVHCNTKIYTKRSAPSNIPPRHSQGSGGPYYKPETEGTKTIKTDKHQPTFKTKSRKR